MAQHVHTKACWADDPSRPDYEDLWAQAEAAIRSASPHLNTLAELAPQLGDDTLLRAVQTILRSGGK